MNMVPPGGQPTASFFHVEGDIAAADLFGDMVPPPPARWRACMPGLTVAALGALAAAFLAERYGAPLTAMALLIGLALNFLGSDRRLQPGLDLAARSFLRWGIVLVGLKVTLGQLVALGPVALAAVAGIAVVTLLAGVATAHLAGRDTAFGLLAGGAVAICGASAAMAIATTIGPRRAGRDALALVLVGISAFSAGAMILYPMIAHGLGLSDRQAGFVLGAAIHDVAQALGAGFSYSPAAGHFAAIVKLSRVALLAPLLVAISWFLPAEGAPARLALPWYVLGFFLLACVNSFVALPPLVGSAADMLASSLLALAVTAVAIGSPIAHIRETGLKPLLVILVPSLAALLLSLAAATWLLRP